MGFQPALLGHLLWLGFRLSAQHIQIVGAVISAGTIIVAILRVGKGARKAYHK
jgi:hypothetical protein